MKLLLALSFVCIRTLIADFCAFCEPKIIANQSVFTSKFFHIIIDYAPRAKGHLLIVPQKHAVKAHELSQEEWTELSSIVPKIVNFFSNFFHTDQYILLEKNGPLAFQNVPHVHFHIIPLAFPQTWADIFHQIPPILSQEEIEERTTLFRPYFSS